MNYFFSDNYYQSRHLQTCSEWSPPLPCVCVEVIEVSGYTVEEKVEIAGKHLLPKQLEQHGLLKDQLHVPPTTLAHIGEGRRIPPPSPPCMV